VKQHQENNIRNKFIKMKTVWQVEVTKKPMDDKNELKMMEMGLKVCTKKCWYAKE
jgi:hypothetical protein